MVVQIRVFLTSTLDGGDLSASRPERFTPGEIAPCTHCIRGRVDRRAGLGDVNERKILILQRLELRHILRLARSQSLYRLSSRGFSFANRGKLKDIFVFLFYLYVCDSITSNETLK
jgi:hypothetical protein